MKSFALEFFIEARFVNLAVSLPHYQFASHTQRIWFCRGMFVGMSEVVRARQGVWWEGA
jgi:hypothetical protein